MRIELDTRKLTSVFNERAINSRSFVYQWRFYQTLVLNFMCLTQFNKFDSNNPLASQTRPPPGFPRGPFGGSQRLAKDLDGHPSDAMDEGLLT